MTTIDKIPFKVTITNIVSLVLATAVILGAYYNLQMGITQANVSIAQVYKEVKAGNEINTAQHSQFLEQITNHETRISRLEGREK